ncbi:MAG: hypothetical protein ACYDDF_00070 [Thermoplasmatota archaeon]
MTQPLFIGSDPSSNPLVEDMLRAAQTLTSRGVRTGALTARYGLRAIASQGKPLDALGPGDFVEIADYDPATDRALVLGPASPHGSAGLHNLVLRGRREIEAIIEIQDPGTAVHRSLRTAQMPQVVPGAKGTKARLDVAFSLLEILRTDPVARLSPHSLLAVGRSPLAALGVLEESFGWPPTAGGTDPSRAARGAPASGGL